MKLERIKIDEIKQDINNARRHGKKDLPAILGSLKLFGQQKPIVINKDGVIVAGNGTYQAAKKLKWKEIWVVRSELEINDERAYALADNRTSELSEWDEPNLTKSIQELQEIEFDLNDIGFDNKFISKLLGEDKKAFIESEKEFLLVVECSDEVEQREIFDELSTRDIKCKIIG